MPQSPKSLEMMIGGLLEAVNGVKQDIQEIRRDIKDSEARQALAYEQSEERAARIRASIYAKADEVASRLAVTESKVEGLAKDMVDVKTITDEVKAWKQRGIGALFVTGIASASLGAGAAAFVAAWWDAIMRALRAP